MSRRTAWFGRRGRMVMLGLLGAAAPVEAQDSVLVRAVQSPERVRFVVSGGMAIPTGGFSTYHELGAQASVSAIVRLVGQRVRLRPEVMYSKFNVLEEKVRALVAANTQRSAGDAMTRQAPVVFLPGGSPARTLDPRLPDLRKLGENAVSSLLGAFASLEIPLGPRGFQPYLVGGVGAVSFRTDVTTVGEALDGIQWAGNVGAGLRFRMGPIGAGFEARFRGIPIDETRTFFDNVAAIPVSFSLVF